MNRYVRIPKKVGVTFTNSFTDKLDQAQRDNGCAAVLGLIPFFLGLCDFPQDLPSGLLNRHHSLWEILGGNGDLCRGRIQALRRAGRAQFHFSTEDNDVWVLFSVYPKGKGKQTIFQTSAKFSSDGIFLLRGSTTFSS